MHKPFLPDFDNNILSRMYPDGKIINLKEEQPNDDPLKSEKELGDESSETFIGIHRY